MRDDHDVWYGAVFRCDATLFEWAARNGCPLNYYAVVETAVTRGCVKALRWLHDSGHPYREGGCPDPGPYCEAFDATKWDKRAARFPPDALSLVEGLRIQRCYCPPPKQD